MSARYVVFEGGEGCGKSTQSARFADSLAACHTREPGGTSIGGDIRRLLLDPATQGLDPRAEALLMAADRAQHAAEVVAPALAAGRHVVSDRSAYSSLAYQGYGRGLPLEEIRSVSDWALQGRWPDLVVLLEVPLAIADTRLDRERDRLELEGPDFHQRVADGFRALAAAEPDRFAVVDGTRSVDEVTAAVRAVLRDRLELDA